MPGSHEGRTAIVTGAAKGIGRAIAVKLAEAGADLVLVDIGDLAETVAQVGGSPLAVTADVTRDEDWGRIAETAEARFGKVDIVVNNAGVIIPDSPVEKLSLETWRRVFAVNLESHFLSAQHFAPRMRRQGWGRFVNISSNSIGYAAPGITAYMASKMGVIGFVRALANELGGDGITVNAVLPALTETDATAHIAPERRQQAVNAQAIKRSAKPEDIAGPVVLLTSEAASFITGQAVVVDGGAYKIS